MEILGTLFVFGSFALMVFVLIFIFGVAFDRNLKRSTFVGGSLTTSAGLTLVLLAGIAPHYSEGSRAGIIVKVSRKGLFWKSYEGEMLTAGPQGFSVEKFEFNIEPENVNQVMPFLKSGVRVELVYRQWMIN